MSHDGPVLGMDTSGETCSAALVLRGRILTERNYEPTAGRAEELFPVLQDMLAMAGLVWKDVRTIGVVTGPGNFTGIRLAVAAARGLAMSLSIPATGINSFAAAAFAVPRPCLAVIGGTGSHLYAMRLPDGEPVSGDLDRLETPERPIPVVGGEAAAAAAKKWKCEWRRPVCAPGAAAAKIAETAEPVTFAPPVPFFVRPPLT